jgi:hypothetical protein
MFLSKYNAMKTFDVVQVVPLDPRWRQVATFLPTDNLTHSAARPVSTQDIKEAQIYTLAPNKIRTNDPSFGAEEGSTRIKSLSRCKYKSRNWIRFSRFPVPNDGEYFKLSTIASFHILSGPPVVISLSDVRYNLKYERAC